MTTRMDRDPRRLVRRIYRNVDGFDISAAEERLIDRARGAALYGEILPASVARLLAHLRLGEHDVFYDLGAGVGKVVVQAAMTLPLRRCVGVELSPTRSRLARAAVERARSLRALRARETAILEQNLLEADLRDATAVYTCSTGFPDAFTRAIVRKLIRYRRPLTLVSTQILDDHPRVALVDTLRLDMSWVRRTNVYVYRLRYSRVPE